MSDPCRPFSAVTTTPAAPLDSALKLRPRFCLTPPSPAGGVSFRVMPSAYALDAALEHHRAGRLSEAEAAYRHLLAGQPNDPSALHLLGMLLHQTARNPEALDLLELSVRLAPHAAHFRSNLAGVLGRLGRSDEALTHLREVVRLQPTFPQGHNNLGVALESLGRLEEAAEVLRRAIRLQPDYPEAHNNLGNVLLKRGPLAEAVECYRTALRLRPGYAEAHGNLASALGELGRVEEALEQHRRVVDGDLAQHLNRAIDKHPVVQRWIRFHLQRAFAMP